MERDENEGSGLRNPGAGGMVAEVVGGRVQAKIWLGTEEAMGYLLVRHKVKEFQEWKRFFDSHKDAQRQSGLRIEKVMRNLYEPNEVFLLFEVTDLAKARGFVFSPDVPSSQEISGVVDKPDIYFLA
jgi:hypothetical protein